MEAKLFTVMAKASTLFVVIFVMAAIFTTARSAGPPGGVEVKVINPANEPVPVTGSLGVTGEADVNVVNTPTVEVTNLPAVQSVEVQSPPITGGTLKDFDLEPGDDTDLEVPDGSVLTDLVVSVPSNAKCLFTIYENSIFGTNIIFRTGLGELSESSTLQMHLQTGLPGPLFLQFIGGGSGTDFCSGQLFWTGKQTDGS